MLLLNRSSVAALLRPEDYLDAVERAFRAHGEGASLATGLLHIDAHGGEFHIKSSGLRLGRPYVRTYVGVKVNGAFWQNRARGLPYVRGALLLFDGETGVPLALMDSVEITVQRTAATTPLAARYLARRDARVVTICGTGTQGRAQLRYLARVLPIERVHAFGGRAESVARFAAEMRDELGADVVPAPDLAAAARGSDVIVTCTPSRTPLLGAADVSPGAFVAAVGSDNPAKQELAALAAGLMTEHAVYGELGEIVAGRKPGRTATTDVIVFDSTGTALQDVAAVAVAYGRAAAGPGVAPAAFTLGD
jgi:ornithine cyclodeaminase/alanine dehydrogenase-like protein (mu-crystallin family)